MYENSILRFKARLNTIKNRREAEYRSEARDLKQMILITERILDPNRRKNVRSSKG